jgi:hypothetical protein
MTRTVTAPRHPSCERRSICELFAQMFSMRLESRERQQTVEFERRARDISDQLLGAVASDETLLRDPDWLADILTNAIPADGVGVWLNGSYAFSGVTPPTDDFRRIVRALNATAAKRSCTMPKPGSRPISPSPRAMYRSRARAVPRSYASRVPRRAIAMSRPPTCSRTSA